MNMKWAAQIHKIEKAGYDAAARGEPVESNPYPFKPSNLQRERRKAWIRGWDLFQAEQKPYQPNPCRSL